MKPTIMAIGTNNKRENDMNDDVCIQIHGPDGVADIPIRSYWNIRDVITVQQIMAAAGYEVVAPIKVYGVIFVTAFAPISGK